MKKLKNFRDILAGIWGISILFFPHYVMQISYYKPMNFFQTIGMSDSVNSATSNPLK